MVISDWSLGMAQAQLSHVLHTGGESTKPSLSTHTANSCDVSWRHVSSAGP